MVWDIEVTDQFKEWYKGLSEDELAKVAGSIEVLEERGTNLGYPHSSKIMGARNKHMRELRIQYRGDPYRVLYAFDPRRIAILLLGGNKGSDKQWYDTFVPIADDLYDEHLIEIAKEESDNG